MRRALHAFCFAAVVLFPTSSIAESLRDAMTAAYNNSNLLEQNRALLRAQDENVAVALAALRPQIALSSTITHSDQATGLGGGGGNLSSTVGISMDLLLYDGGNSALAVEAAKQTVFAARAQLLGLEQQVLLGAVQAYIAVVRDSRVVTLRESNLRLITRELRAARDRFEVGEVTRTDVAQAEARLASGRGQLAQAQGDLAISRELYKAAVGKAPGRLTGIRSLPSLPGSVNAAQGLGERSFPDVLQAQRQIKADELNVARARAATKPRIGFNATAGHSNSSDNNSSVSLNMTMPIYQGGQLSAQLRRAQAQVHASRSALSQTVLTTRQNVADSWTQLAVARAQIAASDRQIRAAQVAFDGVREEARLGARTTLDVLDAEQALSDARTNRVINDSNAQLAAFQLLLSMGQLTADALDLPVQRYDPNEYFNAVKSAPVPSTAQGRKLNRILERYSK